MKTELLIALRYTFTQHKEKFVSIINTFAMIGIALGVATLIIVMSVMNGYEKTLFTKILGFKGHITVTNRENKIKNWSQIQAAIEKDMKNIITFPVIESQALLMSNNHTTGVIVKAMNNDDIVKKVTLSDGWSDINSQCEGLILGNLLNYNLQKPERVKIVIPHFHETMVGSVPRMKTYNVCGEFDIGMHEYNSGIVFMNLIDAQLLFQMKNLVSGIEIHVKNLNDVFYIKQQIIQILRQNSFENDHLLVIDWQEANKTLMNGLQVERTVMFLILSLIILIAAFNIISSLILLVHDKMKEIAILRTIGMTKASIMRIFIMSGSLVGIIGTGLGTVGGIIFSYNIEKIRQFLESISNVKIFDPIIYFLTTLPSHVNVSEVIIIVVLSLVVSFIATIYPAWRVSKASPSEILRY